MSLALLDSFLDKGRNSYQTPCACGQKRSPGQRSDTRSLDVGSLTKGKNKTNPHILLVLLSENRLLRTALQLKSIIAWKLKSHQIFHWKTEGAASPSARQRCCSWRERGSQQPRSWTGLPSWTSLTFFGCCWNLPLLLKPWLWYALHAEEIDVGQERWGGEGACRER